MALRYLSADALLADSQTLALNILNSGFQPDLLVALWRGGAPVGLAIHEVLVATGHRCEHWPLRAESYAGIARQHEVRFFGLDQLQPMLQMSTRILLVDDVFDTGLTMQQLLKHIGSLAAQQSQDIRIATPWYKPGNNQTALTPHYHLHTTADWLVFPHELQDLGDTEILAKPGNRAVLAAVVAMRRLRTPTTKPPH